MKLQTRQKFNAYLNDVAVANEVENATVTFTVSPSVEQKLTDTVQLSSDFLKQINMVSVQEQIGETLGLGIGSTIAGRVDTAGGAKRTGINPVALTSHRYECVQTNFDTFLTYNILDSWAKFDDFQARIAKQKSQRVALDRIMIGFNGTSSAKTTDRGSNQLLQDVNKGWLQHIREYKSKSQVVESKTVGVGGDYENLDTLVFQTKNAVIAEEYRDDLEMVVICSAELLNDKYLGYYANATPTEKLAADTLMASKELAGLKVVTVPYFPKNALLITRLDNLSIYTQEGKIRRLIQDQPEGDRVVDFLSMNEAYVVENLDAVALVENISAME